MSRAFGKVVKPSGRQKRPTDGPPDMSVIVGT